MKYEIKNKDGIYLCYFLFVLFNIFPVTILFMATKITDAIVLSIPFIFLDLYTYYFIFLQHAIGNIFKINIEQGTIDYTSIYRSLKVSLNDIKLIRIKKIKSWMGSYDIIIIKLKKRFPIHLSMQEVSLRDEVKIKKAIETYLMPIK